MTDPLKLSKASREVSDSAERTLIQLSQLEGVANSHVEQRLEQIRSILNDALNGSDTVIQHSIASMRGLETQVNIDANNLIYKAKCAADVTLLSTTQKAFANLITNLNRADPSIRIFGINIIDLHTNNIEITDPDIAYRSAKKLAFANLISKTSDSSPAYNIFSTYQNIEIIARYNRCYYLTQVSADLWAEEANELERLSVPWTTFLEPDINYNP